jgi:hypothetical protein
VRIGHSEDTGDQFNGWQRLGSYWGNWVGAWEAVSARRVLGNRSYNKVS